MDPGSYAIINRDYRYIHYSEGGEELYEVQTDPNEWYNLANNPQFSDTKATLHNAAPKTFAKPGTKLNTRRNLVIDGESFYWKE